MSNNDEANEWVSSGDECEYTSSSPVRPRYAKHIIGEQPSPSDAPSLVNNTRPHPIAAHNRTVTPHTASLKNLFACPPSTPITPITPNGSVFPSVTESGRIIAPGLPSMPFDKDPLEDEDEDNEALQTARTINSQAPPLHRWLSVETIPVVSMFVCALVKILTFRLTTSSLLEASSRRRSPM